MLLLTVLQFAIIPSMIKNLLKPYKEKSAELGINASYLMQIANGYRNMPWKIALKIHKEYGIPLWELRPDMYPKEIFDREQSWLKSSE